LSGDRPRLLAERCATCVFRPGNWMHLAPGRLRDLVDSNLQAGALLICHDTLDHGQHPEFGEAMCRGFWDAHGDKTQAKQVMDRLFGPDWFEEVAPPA
jgi:hypothetical protein